MLNSNKKLSVNMHFKKKILLVSISLAVSSLALASLSFAMTDSHDHDEPHTDIAKPLMTDHEEHNDDHNDGHADEHKDDHNDEHQDEDEHAHGNEQHQDEDEHGHDEHEGEGGDEHGHGEQEEAGFVKLSAAQQAMAGIKVAAVKAQGHVSQVVSAPGEVVNDLYNTTLLTTQIDSKVLKRKVVLGQHVSKGDVIAVLYSLDIATAQNQLKVALSEWQRVKSLGKQTVGAKRYIAAKADFEKNKALLQAYGFNEHLIEAFIKGKNAYKAGEYPVIAPHDGVILEDNFQSGQFLGTGATIARLVDEDDVWVEALLAPEIGQKIPVGTTARVIIANKTFAARVIHDSHAIDEITRTRKIRLFLENKNHLLHAGLFAKVFLQLPLSEKVILLPETALMRSSDGDWTVFIEQEPGVFKQQEVELENTINGMHSVKGLKNGQRVALEGAFFLASEMAKGGFDPHNH